MGTTLHLVRGVRLSGHLRLMLPVVVMLGFGLQTRHERQGPVMPHQMRIIYVEGLMNFPRELHGSRLYSNNMLVVMDKGAAWQDRPPHLALLRILLFETCQTKYDCLGAATGFIWHM